MMETVNLALYGPAEDSFIGGRNYGISENDTDDQEYSRLFHILCVFMCFDTTKVLKIKNYFIITSLIYLL